MKERQGTRMKPLSKSKLIAFRQCPKRLWLEVNGLAQPETDALTQARYDDGHAVGKLAQSLYNRQGKGTVFEPSEQGYDEVVRLTQDRINSTQPLFEAGFHAAGARAYVDVLLPSRKKGQKGWRMVEVKSSTEVKDTHKDDIAIQAYIARQAGVNLHAAAIAHIDKTWKFPGGDDYQGFLVEVDQTEEAFGRAGEVEQWIAQAHAIVRKRKAPTIEMGTQCNEPYACAYLEFCQQGAVVAEYPVAWLPRQGKELKLRIEEAGWTDLSEVPDEYLNAEQLRVKTNTLDNTCHFDEAAAGKALVQHKLPAYFLDFESINLTIPIWKGIKPFQQIAFQFSLHSLSRAGKLTHKEFLDLSGKEPSRKLALALIAACGQSGPIFVYSSFESTRIKDLAKRLPRLAKALLAIHARLVDLHPVVKAHYYHPDQQGSWSIKYVLPTIAPDLNYDTLDGVKDGTMAMLAYREAIDPDTPAPRKLKIERELLDYCCRDTIAMLRLWQHLTGRAPLKS